MTKSLQPSDLARITTGRAVPIFADDVAACQTKLHGTIAGRRILVVGGAGCIGGATIRALIPYQPAALHVVDLSENNLVEMVRELRGSSTNLPVRDFRTLPLDYGSEIFHRYLLGQEPYDHVLNFAALKHVRSEKEICSVLQMLETNVLKQARLLRWMEEHSPRATYFSVSTDKAANPVNLMGASKRMMEHVMFGLRESRAMTGEVTSARFANVAFSDGSLLHSWSIRLSKGQPLAVPRLTRRYFVSVEEAGQICLLAGLCGRAGHIYIPKFNPEDLRELAPIACRFLEEHGFTPRLCEDLTEAISGYDEDVAAGRYPVLLTPLDTMGEKAYEEFVGDGESVVDVGLPHLEAVTYRPASRAGIESFLETAHAAIQDATLPLSKSDVIAALANVISKFHHAEAKKGLDERF